MKITYLLHPRDYALGQTEKFYTEQAAKGWQLVNRGFFLSKFQRTDPKSMRYRVEIVPRDTLVEGELPEAQRIAFEECGWEYVDGCGMLHIFRTPADSDAPEFYLEPEQQAQTLTCLSKFYRNYFLQVVILLLFQLFALRQFLLPVPSHFVSLVTESNLLLAAQLLILLLLIPNLIGLFAVRKLRRSLAAGIPLNHNPKHSGTCARCLTLVTVVLALVLCVLDLTGRHAYPMPETPEADYLMAEELGIHGERTTDVFPTPEPSYVKCRRSLLAKHRTTTEFLNTDEGFFGMEQELYELSCSGLQSTFADSLLSAFAGNDHAVPVEISGLDRAWLVGNDRCMGQKGNFFAVISFSGADLGTSTAALELLAQRWN